MTSRGRDSVAETGTPASALYVIESAANGARLHFPPSQRIERSPRQTPRAKRARVLSNAASAWPHDPTIEARRISVTHSVAFLSKWQMLCVENPGPWALHPPRASPGAGQASALGLVGMMISAD